MTELHELTAVEQRRLLEVGEIRPLELAEHYLHRIEQLNPALHAFTTVTADAALERAEALENERGTARPARPAVGGTARPSRLPATTLRCGACRSRIKT